MFGPLGMPELILILIVVLVIFGAGKIPEIGSALGKGIRDFKKSVSEADEPKPQLAEKVSEPVKPPEAEKKESEAPVENSGKQA